MRRTKIMGKKNASKGSPDYPMHPEAYARQGGVKCPFCGSHELTSGAVEVDEGGASQSVTCDDCDSEWEDLYTLTGYKKA